MKKTTVKLGPLIILTLLAGLALHISAADPCRGSQADASTPQITLDARNEPLGSVLTKISKTTRWKIKAPDKWMEKPVSQTLNKATLEDGLKSVLRNAGIENILLMYDENNRAVTLFDTEIAQQQMHAPADRRQTQASPPPPVVSTANESAPQIKRPERSATSDNSYRSRRARRQSRSEDD